MPQPITREQIRAEPLARPLVRLLGEAVRELSATEGTIWVVSPDGTHLQAAINIGSTRELVEAASVAIDASVIGMVASTGLAMCIGPDDWHNVDVDRATGTVTNAMAAVPLRSQQEIVGVVSVINPQNGIKRFSGTDLETLQWKALLMSFVVSSSSSDVHATY